MILILSYSQYFTFVIMVHVKYPSMERQDLTQAQLGSFKFTPVDEAAPSNHPHPLLLQQSHQALQDAGFLNHSVSSPDMSRNPSFFNQQIAPSLDTSRLRLGPATVRAAVESAATSPQKRLSHSAQATMRPNVRIIGSTVLTKPLTILRHRLSVLISPVRRTSLLGQSTLAKETAYL